jgi:ABC-type tungstate transport system substrate-binding protein
VEFVIEMFRQGINLLDHDPYLGGLTVHTIQLASWSTLIAAIVGFPCAMAIGLGRAHASRWAIRRLPDGLFDQARAYGAPGWRLGVFALREARVGAVTAVIVAMGSAIAEVGAVTIIGGNSTVGTATLASQILNDVNILPVGDAQAVEHLIVLLGLMAGLGVVFTLSQQWDSRFARRRGQPLTPDLSTAEVAQ